MLFHFSEIACFSSSAFALILSQFLYISTPAAIAAPIPRTIGLNDTNAIAAFMAVNAFDIIPPNAMIFGANVISWPIPIRSFPPIRSTGPMAATIRPIFAIICCCFSLRLLNQSTSLWMNSATLRIVGASASPRDVAATSMLDFSFSIDPPNPLIMALAISAVVPSFSRAFDRSDTSLGAVLIRASQLLIWFFPKIADAAAICSDSDSPAKASCNSFCTVMESFMDPSLFVTEIPSLSIHAAASFDGDTRRAIPVLRDVAALFASIPAFAMTPIYNAASFIL